MTHTNLGHAWECNTCGEKDFSEDEWMPDGWICQIEPTDSEEHYCSLECWYLTMTPEEREAAIRGTWIAGEIE